MDGYLIASVGEKGSGPLQFNAPRDGKFVGQFGTEGSGPGQLNSPFGITIDTAATGL
uniref:Uncharacterized protein n=1 Tax=Amphimedon queenslandica TaxID=400682 RepID=A0A1X7T0Z5_AMPQE